MNERNSFVFYRSFYDALSLMSSSDRAVLYEAIAQYAFEQKIIDLPSNCKGMFLLIKPQLDANQKRFIDGKKGGKYGKKGGRPKKENPIKNDDKTPQGLFEETPNVNDNVNDNVNEDIKEEVLLDEFSKVWDLYDFKDAKKPSFEKFKVHRKNFEKIISTIPAYKEYLLATGYKQCSLAVWLNQERYKTDYKQLTGKHNEKARNNFSGSGNARTRPTISDAVKSVDEQISRGEI